jgi:hypothetical protein
VTLRAAGVACIRTLSSIARTRISVVPTPPADHS